MLPPTLPTALPPQLAGFPAAVLEAYARFQRTGDAAAVQAVVLAAVMDYMPKRCGRSPPFPLREETRLAEDLGYDSVGMAELIFFFEDLFNLTLTNEEVASVRTIRDLRGCVIRKVAEKRVRFPD